MPGFDRTGPRGRGMKTGRGMGVCPPDTGEDTESRLGGIEALEETVTPAESAQEAYGAPFGSGRGAGRGRGPGARQAGIYGVGRGGIPRGCGRGFCGGRMRRGLF